MSKPHQRTTNVAVDQILENMSPNLHSSDGQYVPLGFTPPPTPAPAPNSTHWPQHPKAYYHPTYGPAYVDDTPPPPVCYSTAAPFTYLPPPRYVHEPYEPPAYPPSYSLFVAPEGGAHRDFYAPPPTTPTAPSQNPIIEHVVGNWVPNTTGTYSPFGTAPSPAPSTNHIYSPPIVPAAPNGHYAHAHVLKESNQSHLTDSGTRKDDVLHFHFSRDARKPRAIAEVKPMQPVVKPSYSDVLAKSVPPPGMKTGKVDANPRSRKENARRGGDKTTGRGDKVAKGVAQKMGNGVEWRADKNCTNGNNGRSNGAKSGRSSRIPQLNRKWASLDNVNESVGDSNDEEPKRGSRKFDEAAYATGRSVNASRTSQPKSGRKATDFEDVDSAESGGKSDALNVSKTSRKGNKSGSSGGGGKQRNGEYSNGTSESKGVCRRGGTRNGNKKRNGDFPLGFLGRKMKEYIPGWWKILMSACLWLFHLISDTISLSIHLSHDLYVNVTTWLSLQWISIFNGLSDIVRRIQIFAWLKERFRKETVNKDSHRFLNTDLQHNIVMPTTGDEAMKRLLACKGKDPYSILGVTPLCTDDDIKRYYKKQAFLVHPDKNQQPGAEEAFKILVHAFNMIGEAEHRANYDRGVAESAQVEQAWSELTELLAQLQKKVDAAANTIRCSACGSRHKRIKMERPCYAARHCAYCKIHHSAREGDIWAEARFVGFFWHYYACMEGGVYDITEWAGCQKDSLKHLKPDSHQVQYRIALGKQNGQARKQTAPPRTEPPPDLENLLNSLYGNQENAQSFRRKNKKTNK